MPHYLPNEESMTKPRLMMEATHWDQGRRFSNKGCLSRNPARGASMVVTDSSSVYSCQRSTRSTEMVSQPSSSLPQQPLVMIPPVPQVPTSADCLPHTHHPGDFRLIDDSFRHGVDFPYTTTR
eukprot:CAMPEP_0197245750 /NCGR_PEP_ID=MMETSP1429-20130617/10440_1 /TAXON_ID=49237 /ORGANISM="Chaetoceros  sp., Strain UNC1202" /LENGTH=122 /DNA_ID=CAMNT_0042706299 /DNA_START=40 /DNA_END=405 /DNA_ORIENTATION=+